MQLARSFAAGIAFDVMHINGRDTRPRSLRDRRVLLEDMASGSDLIFAVRRLAARRAGVTSPNC